LRGGECDDHGEHRPDEERQQPRDAAHGHRPARRGIVERLRTANTLATSVQPIATPKIGIVNAP
jgi:hypothetical protein